jgi:replicative DNA helicase
MAKGFNKAPNYATWVYKNRAGLKGIVVWSYYNLGNMREEPLFVTDYDYNIVDLAKTEAIDEDGEQGEIIPKVDF